MNSDNLLSIVNHSSSLLVFLSTLALIIFCFGCSKSKIYKYGNTIAYTLKFSTALCCICGLYNLIQIQKSEWCDTFFNIGVAFTFVGSALFYYRDFITRKTLK